MAYLALGTPDISISFSLFQKCPLFQAISLLQQPNVIAKTKTDFSITTLIIILHSMVAEIHFQFTGSNYYTIIGNNFWKAARVTWLTVQLRKTRGNYATWPKALLKHSRAGFLNNIVKDHFKNQSAIDFVK